MTVIRPKNLPAVTAPTAADVLMLDGATLRGIAIENLSATMGVHAADIVAAATLNLDAVIGDLVDVTGNTGITAITLSNGDCRTVRFTGTPLLTNGASLVLPGGNIQAAPGDFAVFRGYAAGIVRCVDYQPIGGFLSSNVGVGYSAGAGGTVLQATSKATGVTLSKASGQITLNNASLGAGTIVSFVLTNTLIAATDVLVLNHISGGTPGSYTLNAQAAAGSATINVRNNTAGALVEAIVIQFALIKAVNA